MSLVVKSLLLILYDKPHYNQSAYKVIVVDWIKTWLVESHEESACAL